MKAFTAIIFVMAAAYGTMAAALPVKSKTATGNKCCPPDRYSVKVFAMNTTVNAQGTTTIQGVYRFSVDYTKQVMAINGSFNTGKDEQKVHFIIYPNMSYTINDEKNTCVKGHAPYTPKTCLSDAVVDEGPFAYGKLVTEAYSVISHGYNMYVTMLDNCLPINLVEAKTSEEMTTVYSSLYTDISTSVDDRVFVPPSYCPHL